jgi:hypothetical protein
MSKRWEMALLLLRYGSVFSSITSCRLTTVYLPVVAQRDCHRLYPARQHVGCIGGYEARFKLERNR